MGDPAGIGPEVLAAAWGDPRLHAWSRPFVIGHPEILRRAAQVRGAAFEIVPIDAPEADLASASRMPVLASSGDEVLGVPLGRVDPRAGEAAYQALMRGIDLALAGQIEGLVTAPLSKQALALAGHPYPGHTEILAARTGTRDFAMMLYLGPGHGIEGPAGLGVVHVTLHVGLRAALDQLSTPAIVEKIQLAAGVFRRLGVAQPRIGVAALNPHGGEGGLFGDEESRLVAPAVAQAQALGCAATGPWPADALFSQARRGKFDAVVALYHDQGHIALKLLDQHRAVNVTLGLPIVRTSVAHGTAFDIAGQGRATWSGLIEAVRVAAQLATSPPPRPAHGATADAPAPAGAP